MITLSHGSQFESCTSLSLVVPSGSLRFFGVLWCSLGFSEALGVSQRNDSIGFFHVLGF